MLCLNNYFFQGFFAIFYSMFFNINSKSCLAPNFGKIPMPQPSDVISNLLILKYFLLLNYYFILITIRFKLGSLHSQNFAHARPRKFAFFHKARYKKYKIHLTQSILVKLNSRTSVYIEIDSSKNFRGPTIIFKSAYQEKLINIINERVTT